MELGWESKQSDRDCPRGIAGKELSAAAVTTCFGWSAHNVMMRSAARHQSVRPPPDKQDLGQVTLDIH